MSRSVWMQLGAIGLASICISTSTDAAPSSRIGTAPLVGLTNLTAQCGADETSPGLQLGRPNEIVELARALSNNPDHIYDFVKNNVEISWTYGLQKGALGALIDRHGTAFDQAHLMVELLREASYSARYRFGTLTLSSQQFSDWTGITNARAACQLLSSGGIPASINGSGENLACSTIAADAAVSTVRLAHVWVSVDIGGNTYEFDPSYKKHTFEASVDLTAAAQLVPGQTLDYVTTSVNSGSTSGVPFARGFEIDALNFTLRQYGERVLTHIETQRPADTIEQIVGAPVIERVATGVQRDTALASATANVTWTENIPDKYRTQLRVEILKDFENGSTLRRDRVIDSNLFVDEIYGRKLVVEPNYPVGNHERNAVFSVQLRLTDRGGSGPAIASFSTSPALDSAPLRSGAVRLTANHPYPASAAGGTNASCDYMDAVVEKPVTMFLPLTIIHGWGRAGEGLAETWGSRLDTAAPQVPYGEIGCDTCEKYYFATKGDGRREQLAAAWMVQSSRAASLHAAIARSVYAHHHSLGVSTADSWAEGISLTQPVHAVHFVITDSFDRIDVDSAFSLTSKTADAATRRAAVHAIAATSEALEGSVSAQVADLPDTSSTATRFEWGNRPPANEDPSGAGARYFYRYDASNYAQAQNLSVVENMTSTTNDGRISYIGGEPELGPTDISIRRQALANAVAQYAGEQFEVIAANDAFLGPGQRGGPFRRLGQTEGYHEKSQQRGGALVATRYQNGEPVEIAHVIVGHDENSKGGGGGAQSNHQAIYDPAVAADVLKSRFVDRSTAVGVDLLKGAVTYVAPAEISIGSGGFPYELKSNLIWLGGNQTSTQFGPIAHTQPQAPWTTSWHNNLTMSGSALEAMGATDARAAAGTIGAFLAQQDIYRETDPAQRVEREVAAVLVGAWWLRELSGNVITVSLGADTRQFVRNARREWFSPGDTPFARLAQTGERAPYMQVCGGDPWNPTRGWNYSGMSFRVTNTNGDAQQFNYWENRYHEGATASTCGRLHGFRLTGWSFPQGVAISFVYTPQGTGQLDRFTEVVSSLGRRIRFNYDTEGRIAGFDNGLSGADFRAVVAGYELDRLRSVTDPGGQAVTRFTTTVIGQQHRLVEVYDADDAQTVPSLRYTYDSLGRVMEARDAVALQDGTRDPYQFLIADGVRGERIDPAGGRYTVFFDERKKPIGYMDEIGRQTSVIRDGRGRVKEYIYPEGDRELFEYDARNNTTKLTRRAKPGSPLADVVIEAEWHPLWNKPVWIDDAKNKRTDLAYYESGNGTSLLHTATRPAPVDGGTRPVYTFTYNELGQVRTTTDPTNLVVSTEYHPDGNVFSVTRDPTGLSSRTRYTYDAIGNVMESIDPRRSATSYVYDKNRRRTHTLHHAGTESEPLVAATKTDYDLLGQVRYEHAGTAFSGTEVSAWQLLSSKDYTKTGKLYTDTNGAGDTTTYRYDAMDRPFEIQDAVGRRTRFEHDLAGQQLREIRAFGTSLQQDYATYSYTPNGQRETVKDANGNVSTFVYDGFDRLWRLQFPEIGSAPAASCNPAEQLLGCYEEYGYDENGNRTSLRKRGGQIITYTYDFLDRETLKDIPGGSEQDVYSGYDLAGRPEWKRFGSVTGPGIDYGYNSTKQLTSETTFGRTLAFLLDANDNRERLIYPDEEVINYEYDWLNRMTFVRENWATSGPGVLALYRWDALSRRDAANPFVRGNGTTTTYGYDAASRLSALGHDVLNSGQDVSIGFGYTAASQLRARSTNNTAYDWSESSGQQHNYAVNSLNQYTSVGGTSFTYDHNGNLTSDGSRTFGYDVENRLISVSGTESMTLKYDPLGRLYETVSGGVTTQYLYDGDRLTVEYQGSNVVRRYVHGSGVDEPIVWYEGPDLTDKRWLHSDERGSVIAHSNGSGAADLYTYDPYGKPSAWSGSRFRYTGQAMLPEVRLYHYKARMYDPVLGRFLQADPIGYDDDLNLYAYVRSDPLNKVDPSGTECGTLIEGKTSASCSGQIRLAQAIPPVVGVRATPTVEPLVKPAPSVPSSTLTRAVRQTLKESQEKAAAAAREVEKIQEPYKKLTPETRTPENLPRLPPVTERPSLPHSSWYKFMEGVIEVMKILRNFDWAVAPPQVTPNQAPATGLPPGFASFEECMQADACA